MNFLICICFALLFNVAAGFIVSKKSNNKFPYYTRDDWGALPPSDTHALDTPVPYVIIHHTYIPPACYSKDECSSAMKSMQNYHMSMNWGDIGYNFCIGTEGSVYEGRGWNIIGIHTGKANNYSIGICLIGDWREALPPPEQLATTQALIASGLKQGLIKPDYKIIGHRQVMATECPGAALFDEISKWEHFSRDGFNMNDVRTKNSIVV